MVFQQDAFQNNAFQIAFTLSLTPGSSYVPYPEWYEEKPTGRIIMIRVRFGTFSIEKRYRIAPMVVKILVAFLGKRKLATRREIIVGAKRL